MLDQLFDYMLDNISNLASAENVSDNLVSKRIKTNDKTIGNYIS